MVSDRAKQAVEQIFVKAARESMALGPGNACEVRPLSAGGGEFPEGNLVVFTISSFLFRLLTIFHVQENPATVGYFVRDGAKQSFSEIFSEVGNLCCGTMNRDLLRIAPHLGMSTPYTLGSKCVRYLDELKPGHVARFAIIIDGAELLQATLCFCEYAPVDFALDAPAEEQETGALELF